jgi:glycosyltransferase involved in cell wall biosynthesis
MKQPTSINWKINDELELHPGMTIDEIRPNLDGFYAYASRSNEEHTGEFQEREWNAAYCTCYARSAIDQIGRFDTCYQNGCEDLDLEHRLRKGGFVSGVAVDSFVLHFGGVTRYQYQCENIDKYNGEDQKNHDKYQKKWAHKKVAIYTGPAWEKWDWETVEAGMAGSESWAVYIAEEFARLGWDVTIYGYLGDTSDTKTHNGVRYVNFIELKQNLQYDFLDILISSRSVDPLRIDGINSIKTFVMIHDVWLSPDQNFDLMSWRVNKFFYLSPWHKKFLLSHHNKMPADKMHQTSNGVAPYYWTTMDHHKCNWSVYSSSPDRGLYQLLQMIPTIKQDIKDFELHICYGFYNWESAARQRNDNVSIELIDKIRQLLDQPGVVFHDRIPKEELYYLQSLSKIWLYPTWFCESFCISAIENRLTKNAIVTTGLAGLERTAGAGAYLLPPTGLNRDIPYPESYTKKFIEIATRLLTEEEVRLESVEKGYAGLEQYRWSEIVKDFLNGEQ